MNNKKSTGVKISGMFHIGKKVPKGFEELPGGIHLGGGIWQLPMRPLTQPKKGKK